MKPKLVTTLEDYTFPTFAHDLLAGLTVALVALPLSIAIAIGSGAPPAAGLATAIVGGFLISLLGGSKVQIGGPTGAFIVLVYAVIHKHGLDGLVIATLMAGLLLVIAGPLGVGRLVEQVPEPVIDGFTIGIAVVIATGQLKDLLGMSGPPLPAEFVAKLEGLWAMRGTIQPAAAAAGVIASAAIIAARRFAPRLPGGLVAVALVSLAGAWRAFPLQTVAGAYGALPHGLPAPHLPAITATRAWELLPAAGSIAFLAGIESLLSAKVADRMVEGRHRPRAELFAQGVANLGAALFGGLPATGAIARTATNVRAGGRTPVAGLVHALAIWVLLAFFAGLAGKMAMPALAALLVVTAWFMAEPHRWGERLRLPRAELALLLATAALTVLVDLTVAILSGTVAGILLRKAGLAALHPASDAPRAAND